MEFGVDRSFLSALKKRSLLPAGFHGFWWGNHGHPNGHSPVSNAFSLAASRIFFFVFTFSNLVTVCLGTDFFGFILFGVHWAPSPTKSVDLCQIWGIFSHYFYCPASSRGILEEENNGKLNQFSRIFFFCRGFKEHCNTVPAIQEHSVCRRGKVGRLTVVSQCKKNH